MSDDSRLEQIRVWRAEGLLHKEIAVRLGITRQRVQQICVAAGLTGHVRPVTGPKGRRRGTWKELQVAAGNRNRDLPKQIAREAVRRAIVNGTLKKPSECERCHQTFPARRIHGHHRDYSRPLEVEWLCQDCHIVTHHPKNHRAAAS